MAYGLHRLAQGNAERRVVNDRLEIASRVLAGLANNGKQTEEIFKSGGYNNFEKLRSYNVEQTLAWADALLAAERKTRPNVKCPHANSQQRWTSPCPNAANTWKYLGTFCTDCGAEVKP